MCFLRSGPRKLESNRGTNNRHSMFFPVGILEFNRYPRHPRSHPRGLHLFDNSLDPLLFSARVYLGKYIITTLHQAIGLGGLYER